MMYPADDLEDWDLPEYRNNEDNAWKASWMTRSPFRNKIHHEQEMALSPDTTCASISLRRQKYSIRSPTLTPPSTRILREKLLASIPMSMKSCSTQENGSIIDEVYQNVETLLNTMRQERYQEKMRADEEIQQLQEKLARYEKSNNKFAVTENQSFAANDELAECLLETLALLEEECAEWQCLGIRRRSLDNITNQMSSPSPQKNQLGTSKSTPVQKTPSQKLIQSIQRLRTVQSQLKDAVERKSLVSDFEKEKDADQGSDNDDKLIGLELLEGSSDNSSSSIESLDVPTEFAKASNHEEFVLPVPSISDLENEVYELRQQLWGQMVQHGNRVRDLQMACKADHNDKENALTRMLHAAQLETKRVTSQMVQVFLQKQFLQRQLQDQSRTKDAEQTGLHQQVESLQERLQLEVKGKDCQVYRAKNDLVIAQINMMWKVAHTKHAAMLSQHRRERELFEQLEALKVKLVDTERRCFDAQMSFGIEQNKTMSAYIKLEAAMARLDEMDATKQSLQQQLRESKMMARAYSSQVEYLSDELQRTRAETRESLEDRNRSIRAYRTDAALLRDDLNSSFSVMP
jgi:hypothetical protein